MAYAGAVLPLGKAGHVGIVIQVDRYAKLFRKFRHQGEIVPFGDVWRVENGSGVRVKRTWRGNANGRDISILPDGFDRIGQPVVYAWCICQCLGTVMSNGCGTVRFIGGHADMRSADIYGYGQGHGGYYNRAYILDVHRLERWSWYCNIAELTSHLLPATLLAYEQLPEIDRPALHPRT